MKSASASGLAAELAKTLAAIFVGRPVFGIERNGRVEIGDGRFVIAPVGIDQSAAVADPQPVGIEFDGLGEVGEGGFGVALGPMSAGPPAIGVSVVRLAGDRFGEVGDGFVVFVAFQVEVAAPDQIIDGADPGRFRLPW